MWTEDLQIMRIQCQKQISVTANLGFAKLDGIAEFAGLKNAGLENDGLQVVNLHGTLLAYIKE